MIIYILGRFKINFMKFCKFTVILCIRKKYFVCLKDRFLRWVNFGLKRNFKSFVYPRLLWRNFSKFFKPIVFRITRNIAKYARRIHGHCARNGQARKLGAQMHQFVLIAAAPGADALSHRRRSVHACRAAAPRGVLNACARARRVHRCCDRRNRAVRW